HSLHSFPTRRSSDLFTVSDSMFDAASSQKDGKAIRVMVAAQNLARRRAPFAEGSPAELAAPHHQRIFQQVALPQILDQRRDRLRSEEHTSELQSRSD